MNLYINIPPSLYESIREYCYKNNTTKRKTVIQALNIFLNLNGEKVNDYSGKAHPLKYEEENNT